MRKMLISLVFSVLFFGCTSQHYYPKDKVELLEVEKQGSLLFIYYKVPMETMYYSSGVDYSYNKGELEIKIVRAKINSHPKQMVESFLIKEDNGEQKKYDLGVYYVKIPNNFNVERQIDLKSKIVVK